MTDVSLTVDLLRTADLATFDMKSLVAAYNLLNPANPVKKFDTRANGEKRVHKLVDALPAPVVEETAPEHLDTAPRAKRSAKAVAPKTDKPESVASFMRRLILDGLDNAAVWAAAQKKFGLPDSKKSYPAWYRREMNKKGA